MIKGAEDWFPKNRLEALTDGIYAVALTLLVLDLKLPGMPLDSVQLMQALKDQLPNLLTWLLSFWVILIYWESQVRLSRLVDRIDAKLLRIDLVHIGLISLVPFSTSLIGEHGDQGLAVLIYTANLWAISALSVLKITYLQRHIESQIGDSEVSKLSKSAKYMLGGMTLALLLAYAAPGWNLLALLVPKLLPKK